MGTLKKVGENGSAVANHKWCLAPTRAVLSPNGTNCGAYCNSSHLYVRQCKTVAKMNFGSQAEMLLPPDRLSKAIWEAMTIEKVKK